MRKLTRWILNSSHFFSALIAILTSAIVALMSTIDNEWIVISLFLTIIALVFLIRILNVTQLVKNRELYRIFSDTQSKNALEDALLDIAKYDNPGSTNTREKENALLFDTTVSFLLIFAILCFSTYGVIEKRKENVKNQAEAFFSLTDSIMKEYDSTLEKRSDSIEEKLDELSSSTLKINDELVGIKNKLDNIRKTKE